MNTRRALRIPVYGVNPATELAYVDDDPAKSNPGRLAQAIQQTGYRAGQAVET